jgi:hypothetical protein
MTRTQAMYPELTKLIALNCKKKYVECNKFTQLSPLVYLGSMALLTFTFQMNRRKYISESEAVRK